MIKLVIDKKKIEEILKIHGIKTTKQAVELSQKKSLQKIKTLLTKDIRSEYNIKQSDLSKKINIVINHDARANKDVVSSPYRLEVKDKRLGFAIESYKKEDSGLEDNAIKIRKVKKFNRFGVKYKNKKTSNSFQSVVSVEVKKGQVKELMPGHATLATANNYYGAFARGKYIGKRFSKSKSRYPFSRLWTISAGNMFNEAIKKNKDIYDFMQQQEFEKESTRLIKLYSQKYQKH